MGVISVMFSMEIYDRIGFQDFRLSRCFSLKSWHFILRVGRKSE